MIKPQPEDFGTTEEKVSEYNDLSKRTSKTIFYVSLVLGIFIAFCFRIISIKNGIPSDGNDTLYTGIFFGFIIMTVPMLIYKLILFLFTIIENETGRIINFNRALWKYDKLNKVNPSLTHLENTLNIPSDQPVPEEFGTTQEKVTKYKKMIKMILLLLLIFSFIAGGIFTCYKNYDLYSDNEISLSKLMIGGFIIGWLLSGISFIVLAFILMFYTAINEDANNISKFNRALNRYKRDKRRFWFF